jgi:glucosamine kinase
MTCYLGIDAGGTSTRAVLVTRHGRIIGYGTAEAGNYHNVGLKTAGQRMTEAVTAAWRTAGKPVQAASHAFLGCAGVKSRLDASRVRAIAESAELAKAGEVTVENDLFNALAGGLSGRPGIALIAGTGTNCLGRNEEGATHMCGGWGWLLDDDGGAFGLALSAIRAALRSADNRQRPTTLLPAVLAFFKLTEPNEILARFYTESWTPGEIANFAPVVTRLAAEGDATAQSILASNARALRELVSGTIRALNFSTPPEVVLLGGCVRSGSPYQELVQNEIRMHCPKVRLTEPEGSSVAGAARNALLSAGIKPVPHIRSLQFPI